MTDIFTINGASYARAECPQCGILSLFPRSLHDLAYARRPDMTIYCPNGHGWHYSRGESKLDWMRREVDRARQNLAERDDIIAEQGRQIAALKAKAQAAAKDAGRLKKRASGGICPCCSRHFVQMERHMKTKHPTFSAVEVAK